MSGANRIDRTNKEILDWLHQMKGKKDCYSEAAIFFGVIDCGHKAFHHWKNHFVNNAYKKKREVTELIMKENGGKLGKQYMDIPPENCYPLKNITMELEKNHSLKCNIFMLSFECADNIKQYIQTLTPLNTIIFTSCGQMNMEALRYAKNIKKKNLRLKMFLKKTIH